jgi:hypothetical protein
MSEAKDSKQTTPETVTPEQAAQVGGGDGDCGATVSLGPYNGPAGSLGATITEAYEGAVDATSYIMERVSKAL